MTSASPRRSAVPETTAPIRRVRRTALRAAAALVVTAAAVPAAAGAAAPSPAPDGRGYELISPSYTKGLPANDLSGSNSIVLDDDTVLWGAGATPTVESPAGGNPAFLGRRTATGWVNETLTPPGAQDVTVSLLDALPDASTVMLQTQSSPGALSGAANPIFRGANSIVRRDDDGTYRTIVAAPTESFNAPNYGGMSADASTVIFGYYGDLAGQPTSSGSQVYRWRNGIVTPIGLAPDGQVFGCGVTEISAYQATVNSVSADGETVYMQASPSAGCEAPQLYARRGEATIDVSAPTSGATAAADRTGATFAGATPDGQTVYFRSSDQLTADDGDPSTGDIYRFDLPTPGGSSGELTCVTCSSAGPANVDQSQKIVVSADGTHVYFTATGAIGGEGRAGVPQVYGYARGAVRLIASATSTGGYGAAQATPDGRFVVFSSVQGVGEVLRGDFEAAAGHRVDCVSCLADGTPVPGLLAGPDGPSPNDGPGATRRTGLQAISNDGRTVGFFSPARPGGPSFERFGATAQGVGDVFRWHDDTVALVSGTDGATGNRAIGVSPSGRTVFLSSGEPLTADTEQRTVALYAARIGGGFPGPAIPPAPCSGDACQGAPSGPSTPAVPGSTATAPATTGGRDAPAPTPLPLRIRLLKTSGTRIVLQVSAPGEGTIRLSGSDIRTTSRTAKGVRNYAVTAPLTASGRSTLKRRGSLAVRVRVRFSPKGGKAVSKTVNVKIKRSAR